MTKMIVTPAVAAVMLTLAACGGQGDDKLGDQAAEQAEAQADNLEAQADNLEQRADAVEERGEAREEAIDDSDVDTGELSAAQRNALVNGQ